jgi:L-lactate dehydrogenase complex protein LldF
LHIVLVDNGRSGILQSPEFRRSLNCIRCGACMNTCPVYRRSGGHSYGATVPGPIGSVLEPSRAPYRHASLPGACSLCGSCSDVCPVRIPLHHQLLTWRAELFEMGATPRARRLVLSLAGRVMAHPSLYRASGWLARRLGTWLPAVALRPFVGGWTRARDLPPLPRESFRTRFARRKPRP